MHHIYTAALGLAVAAVVILANIPGFSIPGDPSDKLLHFIAFFALALLVIGARPHKSALHTLLWLTAFAGAIELIQLLMHQGREADWGDFGAGVAGATAAIVIVSLAKCFRSEPVDAG